MGRGSTLDTFHVLRAYFIFSSYRDKIGILALPGVCVKIPSSSLLIFFSFVQGS